MSMRTQFEYLLKAFISYLITSYDVYYVKYYIELNSQVNPLITTPIASYRKGPLKGLLLIEFGVSRFG